MLHAPTFDFSSMHKHWLSHDAYATHLFNASSLGLPSMEGLVIFAAKQFQKKIREETLKTEVDRFINEEAAHSRAHIFYNRTLVHQGYGCQQIITSLNAHLKKIKQHWSPLSILAFAVAFENFTAIICKSILDEKLLGAALTSPQTFWRWHLQEEIGHQHVLKNLYQHMEGGRWRKMFINWFVLMGYSYYGLKIYMELLHIDQVPRYKGLWYLLSKHSFFIRGLIKAFFLTGVVMLKKISLIILVLLSHPAFAVEATSKTNANTPPFNSIELNIIKKYFFANIVNEKEVYAKTDNGNLILGLPGAVLASPSNKGEGFSQDYQFHWVRDAALSMKEVVYLYREANVEEKKQLKPYLMNYVNFERKAEQQTSKKGEETLGQPKYNVDASIWEGEWMRPQNDGPALRAITLIAIANLLNQEGDKQYVKEVLVEMITKNLDYVVSVWQKKTFDLWEEVNDTEHFFTEMVQRKALLEGGAFLRQMGSAKKANLYVKTAKQLTDALLKNWNQNRGYITETVNQQYYKGGGINSAIILGALYGNLNNPADPFAINSDRMLSTVYFIRNAFSGLYKVNIDHRANPPLLGRYPNDIYDGNQFTYGNPWILTTNALAEYYYDLAKVFLKHGQIKITTNNLLFFQQLDPQLVTKVGTVSAAKNSKQFNAIVNSLVQEGDKAILAVKGYATCYPDETCYHFSEQVDRTTGKPVSAKDLTWGYASLLSAMQARKEVKHNA